jgi:hypothetical protein
MNLKEEILKLKHGECFIVPESDYGKAEIWLINDIYVVFEIPLYGGEPRFSGTFSKTPQGITQIITTIEGWT